ncbi:MAG: hypothetical protein HY714_00605 [Candidatus Omnitrophica bacterium]|nr:hypothetical protein [Candidatus Omnitrophota bacterium]
MKKLLVFAVLVSAATALGFWSTQKVCVMMKPKFIAGGADWYAKSNLPADKIEAVKALDGRLQEEVHRLCADVCLQRAELLKMMQGPGGDETRVFEKIEEIGRLQIELEKRIASHLFGLKKVLSPGESRQYFQLIEDRLKESLRQCGYSK